MKLSHFFLPHPDTHKKAHLISVKALAIYIVFFIFLQFGFSFLTQTKPGILGIASNISQAELIRLTNEQRVKYNLPPLKENPMLDDAARRKAANMFEEDYWAHYSPSGKDPWGFIQAAGYRFSYAGENLARNFQNSTDVVNAWMSSPSHKENIINSHYQEIGMAVVNGTLKGEQTTLIVQEFGRSTQAIAQVPSTSAAGVIPATQPSVVSSATPIIPASSPIQTVAGEQQVNVPRILIDPYSFTRTLGLFVMLMIGALTLADIYVIRRRAVLRLSARHLPHLALLAVGLSSLLNFHPGVIL